MKFGSSSIVMLVGRRKQRRQRKQRNGKTRETRFLIPEPLRSDLLFPLLPQPPDSSYSGSVSNAGETMPSYQNMKPLRLLVLLALGGVLIATWSSFVNRWKSSSADSPAEAVQPLTGEIDQQTKAFSLSKTDGDHTLYTIRAEQVTNYKDTQKALLSGVVVEIFGKDGTRRDRITAPQCEYDPLAQTLWVPGAVEMNFELPAKSASGGAEASSGQRPQRVVIHTSQLRFDQSTGIATTDAAVRFTFPQGDGQSRGATYDPQQQLLHLRSAVEFRLQEAVGNASGSPAITTIHAGELRYLRDEARIVLERSVEISKRTHRLLAQAGAIWLNEENQVQRAELTGGVKAMEQSATLRADAQAGRALLDFTPEGAIRTVHLEERVRWAMRTIGDGSKASTGGKGEESAQREGNSRRMTLRFTAPPDDNNGRAGESGESGSLERAEARGDVRVILRSGAGGAGGGSGPATGARSAAGAVSRAGTAGQMQVLTGQEADMLFASGGRVLRTAQLRGTPGLSNAPKLEMHGETGAPPRTVTAQQFDFVFSEAGELAQFAANGNVRVVTPVAATPRTREDSRITTSNELLAVFDPPTGRLGSLRQSGEFTYQDMARKARAATALYETGEAANGGATNNDTLTLERAPKPIAGVGKLSPQPAITGADGRISADWIRLFTGSGDLEAKGGVATTSSPAPASSQSAGSKKDEAGESTAEPLHAVADHLRYTAATQLALYEGRTRLWQGTTFLLEAERAEWGRQKNQLTASGKVLTIYRPTSSASSPVPAPPRAAAPEKSAPKPGAEAPGTYVIRAEKVNYTLADGRILYEGAVHARHQTREGPERAGELAAQSLEITMRREEQASSAQASAQAVQTGNFQTTAARIEKLLARGDVRLLEKGRSGSGDYAEYTSLNKQVKLYGKPAVLIDSERGTTKGGQLSYQMGNNSASVAGEAGSQTETRWIPSP
ncbi:MAG: LPS export ABC transporter periplasmic protein LptC [Acidobacteria bacterium]|nr:LPS export ABC transporter periplasmic protein LptC [Acidobacteriota bacterium]